MFTPEMVRKGHTFHSTGEFILKNCMENDPAKEKFGGKKLPACDVHQSAPPLQLNCAEPNQKSTAFEVILISIGLTDLYITSRGGKKTVLDTCLNYRDCSSKSEEMSTQKNILHFDLALQCCLRVM